MVVLWASWFSFLRRQGALNVGESEDKVWKIETVRIVIRSPLAEIVRGYPYKRKARGKVGVTQFLKKRIAPKIGDREVIVIGGNGKKPHGGTKLENLRVSYERS